MKKIWAKLAKHKLLAIVFFLVFFLLAEILLAGFVWAKIKPISKNGQFNILILGMGGAGHEASDLTDSLMVLLANRKNKKLLLVSLPRDIWVDHLKTKINTLYHYGGIELVVDQVEEITGQPIDRILLIDFKVFEKIIDFADGINVKVERSFDDFYYPIPGREDDLCDGDPEFACRYEHLHFAAGWQKMDGQMALKFVRSRNAEGEEGTDFARNKRQQAVIIALKDKIFSAKILANPQKLWELGQTIRQNVVTDIEQSDYLPLLKFFSHYWQNTRFESLVLDGGAMDSEEFLYHPRYHSSGQCVLLPVEGNWEKVREYIGGKIN